MTFSWLRGNELLHELMARGFRFSPLLVALFCGVGVVTAQHPKCGQLDISNDVKITSPVSGEQCMPRTWICVNYTETVYIFGCYLVYDSRNLQVTYKLQYSLSKTTKQKVIVRVLCTFRES